MKDNVRKEVRTTGRWSVQNHRFSSSDKSSLASYFVAITMGTG